ncbi:MAG: glutamate-5-semialdehyde dehydrogenase, partial [Bdellovibrionota bacterium]
MADNPVEQEIQELRVHAREIRRLSTAEKNKALLALADRVSAAEAAILFANAEDLAALPLDATPAFRDRLTLNPARIKAMVESLRQVAALPDPVGKVVEERRLANGLEVRRVRAPLGVILMIFESRPNVILEAYSLAFKSGNAIILRGGSESRATAAAVYNLMDPNTFYGVNDYDRSIVAGLLKRKDLIDVVVPRGGDRLIAFVQETALMPIIKNDRGLCHAFVDESADLAMAVNVVKNAKTQRPGVCNALETVLVHEKVAQDFLPRLYAAAQPLEFRCDGASQKLLHGSANVKPASEQDWDTEHLDLILNCRVVKSLEEALAHIEKHGSKHSETIITGDESHARLFQSEVDAAAVYWNASTRFTDGFELG